jgi:hypothetical protein
MLADSQTFHIFENEIGGFQFGDDTDEILDKTVSWIVEHSVTDQGETLARRPTEHDIDLPRAYTGSLPQLGCVQASY